MKHLNLAIEDDLLERVHEIAAERHTTIDVLVRDYLAELARKEGDLAETRRQLRKLMDNSTARLPPDYKWNREEIYEDRMFPRHEHPNIRGGKAE